MHALRGGTCSTGLKCLFGQAEKPGTVRGEEEESANDPPFVLFPSTFLHLQLYDDVHSLIHKQHRFIRPLHHVLCALQCRIP